MAVFEFLSVQNIGHIHPFEVTPNTIRVHIAQVI